MVIRHQEPWFNDQIKQKKRNRKELERIWRANKTFDSLEEFKKQRNHVTSIMERAETVAANHENDTCFENGLVMGLADCVY